MTKIPANLRPCACGCGDIIRIDPQHKDKLYVNNTHRVRGPVSAVREQLADAKKQATKTTRELTARATKAEAEVEELRKLVERYSFVLPEDGLGVPTWLTPKRKTKAHRATPVLMLSDLHLDEVVDLHVMDGINEYNREIAHKRFERVIESTVKLLDEYVSGVHFDGIVVPLLGDIITGVIHDELARTNVAPPPATISHWVPSIASALDYLADHYGRVFVPVVDGNHDRFYMKTPMKQRAESSLAWIVYNWLADHVRDDDRITFSIPTSSEQLVDVYETTLLLSHGDGFRSSGGVGGLYPSMLKWLLRKHDLYSQTKRDFDFALIGHWHQDLWGQDFVVNGALKGYDEYAKNGGFKYGLPSQQLFIVTPERGITQRMTVYAE